MKLMMVSFGDGKLKLRVILRKQGLVLTIKTSPLFQLLK